MRGQHLRRRRRSRRPGAHRRPPALLSEVTTTSPAPTVGVDLGGTKLLGALVGEAQGDEVPILAERRGAPPPRAPATVGGAGGVWGGPSVPEPHPAGPGGGGPRPVGPC